MPSISSLSGVEKKVMYRGYRIRLATTGPLSNSEQVRPKRFAATPTARPHGPAPITATSSVTSRHLDDLVATGADAHVLDGRVGQVLEPVEIGPRRGWQVREAPHVAERLLPARERLVRRLDSRKPLHLGGHAVERLAVEAIPDAHGDVGERVEYVELGDGEARETVHAHGVAHHHGVEPAAATRPPGGGPEFAAQRPDALGELRLGFRRERPVPHAGRVGLHHAEHRVDRGRRSEEHTSELQSRQYLVCRLLLEKKKKT